MADAEWRSSTRTLRQPGGQSSLANLLGFGYSQANKATTVNQNNSSKMVNKEGNDSNDKENCNDTNNVEQQQSTEQDEKSDDIIPLNMSDAEKVREFTAEAGQSVPDRPSVPMDNNEIEFISKMMIDELLELLSTVMKPDDSKTMLKNLIDSAKSIDKMEVNSNENYKLIAEQADAFVDIWYYALNAACKKGINCSKIFELVHNANMAKRDPLTKKFIKRDDGKIIKPKGWKPPNVENEILSQIKDGAWN